MFVSQDSIAQFHVCFQQPCSDEETAVQVFWSVLFFFSPLFFGNDGL